MLKVLIATDFSENSLNASNYAISMFGVKEVEYMLLNTYSEPRAATTVVVSMNDFLRKESIEGLKAQKQALLDEFDGLIIEAFTNHGSPANIIKTISKKEKVDFVVIGTKGSSSFENLFIGSNTLEVIANVHLPILMIPLKCKYIGIKNLAIASDLHKLNQDEVIDSVLKIVQQHDSEVFVLNVHSDETNYHEALEGFKLHNKLEGVKHGFYSEVNTDIINGIENFVVSKNIDLLAIVARRHNFFERIFHKSVTKELSKLAHFPMLIIHE